MVHRITMQADEEVPQDLKAFFGHPLNCSYDSTNSDALALLHEYKNLPAIDNTKTDELFIGSEPADNVLLSNPEKQQSCDPEDLYPVSTYSPSSSDDNQTDHHLISVTNDESSCDQEDDLEKLVQDAELMNNQIYDQPYTESLSKLFKTDSSTLETEDILIHNDPFTDATNDLLVQFMSQEFPDPNNNDEDLSYDNHPLHPESAHAHTSDSQHAVFSSSPRVKEECLGTDSVDQSPVHHSTPKMLESSEIESLTKDNTTLISESVTIKQEFLSPVDQEIKNEQQHHPHPPLMASQSVQSQNMPTCNSSSNNSMSPQLMPIQIVQTSSGPMQVQPFIHNGQFGIAQVAPCRPSVPGAMMHPMIQPRPPVTWGPMYYPHAMGGCRIVGPDQMRLPAPPMYCPPHEVYMMRPTYGVPVHLQYNSDMQVHQSTPPVIGARLPSNMTVCQRIKLQQQLQNQTSVPSSNEKEAQKSSKDDMAASNNSHAATATTSSKQSSTNSLYSNDPLQQACNIANIQSSTINNSSLLKSPDSGFGESHLETVLTSSESEVSASNPSSPLDTSSSSVASKRRRSMCSLSRQHSTNKSHQAAAANLSNVIYFSKRENDPTGYRIKLDAATSCSAKLDEDRMTYLNKGQYYTLTMENIIPKELLKSSFVKTVISLRFRDDQSREIAQKYWNFWHSRQEEEEAKGIDIDLKNSEGIIEDTLDYIGVNAFTFAWDPHDVVKAPIAVHCLSTDFSNQKGVKGLPLHIQIDTYDDINMTTKYPVHRAYAQIKIFCDKGAERKARDEEKKREKAAKPMSDQISHKTAVELFHPTCEFTDFYTMADLISDTFIYSPPARCIGESFDDFPIKELTQTDHTNSSDTLPGFLDTDVLMPVVKRPRMDDPNGILVYVREAHESVFTALLLKGSALSTLSEAIKEKFPDLVEIRMLYKRTSRGILVKMDDNMVRHLTHESMYMLDYKQVAEQMFDVTLIETDL